MQPCTENNPNTLSLEQEKILWRAKNRFALTKVARHLGFSRLWVDKVFYGKKTSKGRVIEAQLAELGCPGFELHNGHKDGAGRLDGQ